jgi:DNA-binding transcriptional MerR regulator
VRISELSRVSGVPLATVKFYLRDGLLPPGERTGPNQASYGPAHLRRLRLVRALVEVGGVSIAQVRKVLTAVEDESLDRHDMLGTVQDTLAGAEPRTDPDWQVARADVDAFIAARGWHVRAAAPARDRLTEILVALRATLADPEHGPDPTAEELFGHYLPAIEEIAASEIAHLPGPDAPRAVLAEATVMGIALFGPAVKTLLTLAQENASARRFRTISEPSQKSRTVGFPTPEA